jgi:hypothetical protein
MFLVLKFSMFQDVLICVVELSICPANIISMAKEHSHTHTHTRTHPHTHAHTRYEKVRDV